MRIFQATWALVVLCNCSGVPDSTLVEGVKDPQKDAETSVFLDSGAAPTSVDGGSCGTAGASCCQLNIVEALGPDAAASLSLAHNAHWGACLASAEVPCRSDLTCGVCGGQDEPCCTEGNNAGSLYYPQPSVCGNSSLGCNPNTETCEHCGGKGETCCLGSEAPCQNGSSCSSNSFCP